MKTESLVLGFPGVCAGEVFVYWHFKWQGDISVNSISVPSFVGVTRLRVLLIFLTAIVFFGKMNFLGCSLLSYKQSSS